MAAVLSAEEESVSKIQLLILSSVAPGLAQLVLLCYLKLSPYISFLLSSHSSKTRVSLLGGNIPGYPPY